MRCIYFVQVGLLLCILAILVFSCMIYVWGFVVIGSCSAVMVVLRLCVSMLGLGVWSVVIGFQVNLGGLGYGLASIY